LEALEQHLAYIEGGAKTLDKTPSPNPTSSSSSTLNRSGPDFTRDSIDPSGPPMDTPFQTGSGDFVLTEAERRQIIEEERARLESFVSNARQRAISGAEADMRAAQDKLKQLSTDAEFVDLLSSETNASTQPDAFKPGSFWGTQPSTASPWPNSSGNQFGSVNGNQALALLDFSEPPSTTTTTTTTANHPVSSGMMMNMGHSNSTGFLSASSNNPFVPTPVAPAQPGGAIQPVINLWSSRPSQCAPFGVPPGAKETPASGVPSKSTSGSVTSDATSLDARLAQLAGNLAIRPGTSSSTGNENNSMYRAPDGSLTAVNWTGRANPQSGNQAPGSPSLKVVRGSASMSQLHTGPTLTHAPVSTNPWIATTNFAFGSSTPMMNPAVGPYTLQPMPAPVGYTAITAPITSATTSTPMSAGYPLGAVPPGTAPFQSNPIYAPNPTAMTQNPPVRSSLNPFL
uniref:Phosphatidylinositol-binding clathrin assembly protein n=1 Tax=Echinostoma caproni TaxID=27848 RepID=A0A183A7V4_9TREM